MSTIWRPNLGRLRASVAEMEGSESERRRRMRREGRSGRDFNKGAMRARGESVEMQGAQRLSPRSRRTRCRVRRDSSACTPSHYRKECRGICVHGRVRPSAGRGGNLKSVSTTVSALCRVRRVSICVHGRGALSACAAGLNLRARPCARSLQGVQEKSLDSTATVTTPPTQTRPESIIQSRRHHTLKFKITEAPTKCFRRRGRVEPPPSTLTHEPLPERVKLLGERLRRALRARR